MSHKENGLSLQKPRDHILKDVLTHVSIHGAERVVKEIDVSLGVYCPRQADSLLLASAQVDPTLTNLQEQQQNGQ